MQYIYPIVLFRPFRTWLLIFHSHWHECQINFLPFHRTRGMFSALTRFRKSVGSKNFRRFQQFDDVATQNEPLATVVFKKEPLTDFIR
jgi:hypothetical protein